MVAGRQLIINGRDLLVVGYHSLGLVTYKGPFIFYEVGGGGGWWDLGEGHRKKTALKEGPKKIREKGGRVKYFSCALRWDTFYYS